MYRQSPFLSNLEAIKREFEMLLQENLSMKNSMKDSEDKSSFLKKEFKAIKATIVTLQQHINSKKTEPIVPSKLSVPPIIKIGAGWAVRGDLTAPVHLSQAISFPTPIVNIHYHNKYIGIVSNQAIYLLKDNELYLLNTKINKMVLTKIKTIPSVIFREYDSKMLFSQTNNFLYTDTGDGFIRKWYLDGDNHEKYEFDSTIICWAICDNGILVADSSSIQYLEFDGNMVKKSVILSDIDFKPTVIQSISESTILIATQEGKIIMCNITNNSRRSHQIHSSGIKAIDVVTIGNQMFLASGGIDKKVVFSLIDIANLNIGWHSELVHDDVVLSVKFNNNHIISASRDSTFRIWDTVSKDMRIYGHEGPVIAVDSENKNIVSVGGDKKIKIWNIEWKK